MSVTYIGPKSRTERPRKTKIGTEVAHVIHDSDTTSKVKRSRSPGCFTHYGVNMSGSCSGERENLLLRCRLQARSAWRHEALWRPQREERDGGILWRPPAYSLFIFELIKLNQ